jgi:hypothetical protein
MLASEISNYDANRSQIVPITSNMTKDSQRRRLSHGRNDGTETTEFV